MKKIFITHLLAFAAMNINAQLVVDSLGRVGIGTWAPESMLAIEDDENSHYSTSRISCNSTHSTSGINIQNFTDTTSITYGGFYHSRNTSGNSNGINGVVLGGGDTPFQQCVIGLNGLACYSHTAVGVFGGKFLPLNTPVNFAGIYGSETYNTPTFSDCSGSFAGYFDGKVRVTNGIYATVLSPTASASPSRLGGATILSDRGECVTDKLIQVQTLQFLRYDPSKATEVKKSSVPVLTEEVIGKMSLEELEALEEAANEEPEQYLSPVQYGLDAEQLKAVYPELVYEDANGNVSINYVEMVPLLVQSINELSTKLAELEGNSAKKVKAKAETTDIEDNVSEIDMVRMDQNKPNPFSESTVITLNIPGNTQTASIFIYDMSGKQIQSIAVTERGETDITVYARDLTAGMYIYTLVVDGKVEVTRRMIVSE